MTRIACKAAVALFVTAGTLSATAPAASALSTPLWDVTVERGRDETLIRIDARIIAADGSGNVGRKTLRRTLVYPH